MLPVRMPRLVNPPAKLRAFEPRDAGLITSVADDPLIPLITTVPTSGSPTDVDAYLRRQHERLTTDAGYSFAIADSETDDAVGQIGLWTHEITTGPASIGYRIAAQFRRRGYARAALQALTDWAVELDDVERLHLFVEPWNEASLGERLRAAASYGKACYVLGRRWVTTGRTCTPTASSRRTTERPDLPRSARPYGRSFRCVPAAALKSGADVSVIVRLDAKVKTRDLLDPRGRLDHDRVHRRRLRRTDQRFPARCHIRGPAGVSMS